jgi:hypothetical protein
MKNFSKIMLISCLAILLATILALTGNPQAKPEISLALQRPSFVQAAAEGGSAGAPAEVTAMLSQEAGISAYKQTAGPLNLNQVRGLYRTIEMETANYIIGSVPVPNYYEHFDVHVYVHTDGWILAYYLKDQVTSKMIDVKAETISTTHLETVVSIVANQVGESSENLKYYDFRYPNATNILLVAEDNDNGIDFSIQLPSEYVYFERSWISKNYQPHYGGLYINGVVQPRLYEKDYVSYGNILASTLLVDQMHQVQLFSVNDHYGVITITYRVP